MSEILESAALQLIAVAIKHQITLFLLKTHYHHEMVYHSHRPLGNSCHHLSRSQESRRFPKYPWGNNRPSRAWHLHRRRQRLLLPLCLG